jgi:hypothetical protein
MSYSLMLDGLISINLTLVALIATVFVVLSANIIATLLNAVLRIFIKIRGL